MSRRRHWASGGVAVGLAALALAGCGGGSKLHVSTKPAPNYRTQIAGSLPPAGRPRHGGTLTVGQIAGATPHSILPLIGESDCSSADINFIADQYIPLYAGPDGAQPTIDERLSAAEPPVYSNDDKTVTIRIKRGLKWSDGKYVKAQDVIFYLDLLKAALAESPQNWCQYAAGGFPDNVESWSTVGADTVVLQLKSSVNPSWFTADQLADADGGIYPLPSDDWNVDSSGGEHLTDWATDPAEAKAIYDYVSSRAGVSSATQAADTDTDTSTEAGAETGGTVESLSAWPSDPLWQVVDGPFRLKSGDSSTGDFELVPNAAYSLTPKPRLAAVSYRTYATSATQLKALQAGKLDIAALDVGTETGAIPKLKDAGYSVFGGPGWGWFGGIINFQDTTDDFDKVIAQPYIRAVLSELVDQQQIIEDVYHGWAVPAHGPVPTAPQSPYVTSAATADPYPYDPKRAVATLRAHGWRVRPGGRTTCVRPGTGARECGSGIPAGAPISFVWANVPASTAAAGQQESGIFAAEARRAAGIDVQLVAEPFSVLTADYNDQTATAAQYEDAWGVNNYGGITNFYYPTQQGLLSPGGVLNLGGYEDAHAAALMQASVTSPSAGAVSAEAAYLARSSPVFYMPDQDNVLAVGGRVGGSARFFLMMTQGVIDPQGLYMVRAR